VAGLAPWAVPAQAFSTQRLFRARYEGPAGEGSFNLTLYLQGPERYQARAVHSLGKKLWSLQVMAGAGLLVDYRRRAFCRLEGRLELGGGFLPLPFDAFPALLLGRLPEAPAGDAVHQGGRWTLSGRDGRTWSARVGEDGRVLSWTLAEEGRPTVWWRRVRGEAVVSDRERGVQLKWREVVAAPLTAAPPELAPPEGFRLEECGDLDLTVEDDVPAEAPWNGDAQEVLELPSGEP
jgi:hypothetical protein